MKLRIAIAVVAVAIRLFVLLAIASAQHCNLVPGTSMCMPVNQFPPDTYQSSSGPDPRGNLYGDRLWAPPNDSNPYGGYNNPNTPNSNTPLQGESVWGVPSRSRR